jgi:hypothetical protein
MTLPKLSEKKALILQYEERFAFDLSREVLETPKMSFWMILIPLFLLYHVYRVHKVVEGRKGFAANYLITRKRALEAGLSLAEKGKNPDLQSILKDSNLPEKAKGPFKELFLLLVEHYADLLRGYGHDAPSLIRSAYKSRTNYLLFLNRLSKAEKALTDTLRPKSPENSADIDFIVKAMEIHSERLGRQRAELIFK